VSQDGSEPASPTNAPGSFRDAERFSWSAGIVANTLARHGSAAIDGTLWYCGVGVMVLRTPSL
jgi:hypothetical protein